MWKRTISLIVLVMFLSSCATQPIGGSQIPGNPCQPNAPTASSSFLQNPFTATLINFGGNLLATAATNYSQKYTGKLEKFLTKLVTPKKKRKKQSQPEFPDGQDDFGSEFPQEQFPVDGEQGFPDQVEFEQGDDPNGEFQEQFEGEEQDFEGDQFQDIPDTGFDPNLAPQFADQPVSRGVPGRFPIGQPEDPCTQQQTGTPQESYPNEEYPDQSQVESVQYGDPSYQQSEAYDQDGAQDMQQYGNESQPTSGEPIGLDVAMVRKTIRNGTPVILPIKDGDLLRDGRGNPQAGDKFRIMFRTNSDAYVYVIAVDGSGWAQGIFPTPTSPFANPVQANQQYVTPEGSNWFSLDQFKGIETIFFVASHEPRQDIEDLFKGIMGRERPASATPRQVTQAAIVPNGFAAAQPSQTPFGLTLTSGGQQEIVPTSFLAKTAGEDLRITRWFRHE